MASTDLDLNQINFQTQLRSKPVKENFTDIQTNFNALRAEFQAGVASTAAEVVNARDNMTALQDNIHLREVYGKRVRNGLLVSAQGTPDMTVQVATGAGIAGGVGVHLTAAQNSATIATASSGKLRQDAVVIGNDNNLTIVSGPEYNATASNAQYPNIASTQLLLAHVRVGNTTSTLGADDISDRRVFVGHPMLDKGGFEVQFDFNGDTLSTYTIFDQEGASKVVSINYSGATIASLGVTIDGLRYTNTITFTGDVITKQIITY